MLSIQSWPRAILHLDGNAFFASVMQAANPSLKGQPVVVGAERGIATAISYEARASGIERGMLTSQIKRLCPKVIVLAGDYELFSLYSQRMFTILRRYSPLVEEYSVDEGFADLTGLRRPLHASYREIGKRIQAEIKQELDLPVSVGISLTKSLAKLASGFRKPLGLTLVSGQNIEPFLEQIKVGQVWGIGPATTSYLYKFNIQSALAFAKLPPTIFNQGKNALRLSKPHWEIWQELRGEPVYLLNPNAKNQYKSISKTSTFRPDSCDPNKVWAELLNNIEQAFKKARKYGYFVKKALIFLKTSTFRYQATEIVFSHKEQFPLLARPALRHGFTKIFNPALSYRATGCTLLELSENKQEQINLFEEPSLISAPKAQALYKVLQENQKIDFAASLFLRSSPEPIATLPRFAIPMLEIKN